VCSDLFIYDDKTHQRRLKRADEHYSKLVTEFWYTLRFAIESRQVRQLPECVIDELCAREWTEVWGGRIEVEPKEKTKQRLGRSCDLADWSVIAVEGARRLGFVIAKMEAPQIRADTDLWKDDFRRKLERVRENFTLINTG
jgi:hypothetical protein